MFHIPSTNKEHCYNQGGAYENGTEIRLEDEEEHDNPEIEHIREESIEKVRNLRMASFEKICKIDDESKLHELNRLEREWKKWNIDPSSRSIISGSDEKY